jgi:hypothetical protein
MSDKSPFPGMDPYLEAAWGDVHHALCTYSRDAIQSQLGPSLYARVDERTVIEFPGESRQRGVFPDVRAVELHPALLPDQGGGVAVAEEAEPTLTGVDDEPLTESFIQIFDKSTGNRVITVIEFLSSTNKLPGPNQVKYKEKQEQLLAGEVSLVEVNLMRRGEWVVSIPLHQIPVSKDAPYYAAVRRGYDVIRWEYYAMPLQRRLKAIRIPLRKGERDAILDLQAVVEQVYRNGAYARSTDYTRPPDPPLAPDDERWADELLRKTGRRS